MLEKIQAIQKALEESHPKEGAALEHFRRHFIGKKGVIAELFKDFAHLSPAEKIEIGPKINRLKQDALEKFKHYSHAISNTLASPSPALPAEDYTLPSPTNQVGARHPISLLKNKIVSIFNKIGFNFIEGPEIEDDWHNFGALNFPENHPARDMHDTFFLGQDMPALLRTHTTSVQVRVAEKQAPPIRSISIGRVYRNETISARAHCMFHQVDGVYIDKNVNFVALKQLLTYFMHSLFGSKINVRMRPSYFPFTEPSTEIDIDCTMCQGKGCTICKHTGWLEIMGAGMIDPAVLDNCDIDSTQYSGYAFGMGLERVAMLLHQINDLRLFTQNDQRFLKQFHAYA